VNRRIDQAALAQRNCHADVSAVGRLKRVVDPEAVDLRRGAQCQSYGANQQHGVKQSFGHRPLAILFG